MKKMETFLLIFIFVLLVAGFGFSKEKVSKPLYVHGSQFEGVIFSCADSNNSYRKPCWTPNVDQIRQMENHLEAAILAGHRKQRTPRTYWDSSKHFSQYKRQYWGLFEKGHKVIYVNLMCREIERWKEKEIMVVDGGACYLQIKYDVQTGKYFEYMENGEA